MSRPINDPGAGTDAQRLKAPASERCVPHIWNALVSNMPPITCQRSLSLIPATVLPPWLALEKLKRIDLR